MLVIINNKEGEYYMEAFIIITMIFAHTIADFVLQTDTIAKFKQRSNWQPFGREYKYDYIPFLFIHSFMWSFIVLLPLYIVKHDYNIFIFLVIVNTLIHMYIDNEKANNHTINLICDQLLHLMQIIISFIIWYSYYTYYI